VHGPGSDRLAFGLVRGDRPRVMGILNATPDSFSADGLAGDLAELLARGEAQVRHGAEVLDLGGESTRPGATPVAVEQELERVMPVLQGLLQRVSVPLSIDTQKAVVAERALAAGASILNDVSGLRDPDLAGVAAAHQAWLVVTHNGWTMGRTEDSDVLAEVIRGLRGLVDLALRAGVPQSRVIVDPGLGFGKSPLESLELLRRTAELREAVAPLPVLVGASRKGFIGRALGLAVQDRLEGSLACAAIAAFAGAELIRVHDVQPAVRTVSMAWAVRQGQNATLMPEPSA
jgi:dihydropteroate synthase